MYKHTNLGSKTLRKYLKLKIKEAGILKEITPHSARVTGINRMREGYVPEQTAMEETCHESLKGFHHYWRTVPSIIKDLQKTMTIIDPQNQVHRFGKEKKQEKQSDSEVNDLKLKKEEKKPSSQEKDPHFQFLLSNPLLPFPLFSLTFPLFPLFPQSFEPKFTELLYF